MDIDVERLRLMRHYQVTKIHIVGVSEEEERERADNMFFLKNIMAGGFHSGSVVKNPLGNTGDVGSIPNPERSQVLWSA